VAVPADSLDRIDFAATDTNVGRKKYEKKCASFADDIGRRAGTVYGVRGAAGV